MGDLNITRWCFIVFIYIYDFLFFIFVTESVPVLDYTLASFVPCFLSCFFPLSLSFPFLHSPFPVFFFLFVCTGIIQYSPSPLSLFRLTPSLRCASSGFLHLFTAVSEEMVRYTFLSCNRALILSRIYIYIYTYTSW